MSNAVGILSFIFAHYVVVHNIFYPFFPQTGLDLALQTVMTELPAISIDLNGQIFYEDSSRYDELRASEKTIYELSDNGFTTRIAYDQKDVSVQNALFSIYTTSFIIVLLVVSIVIAVMQVFMLSLLSRRVQTYDSLLSCW